MKTVENLSLDWLAETELTQSDSVIRNAVKDILQIKERESLPGKISFYLNSFRRDKSNFKNDYRKRSASEIITSQYQTGCTDAALMFVTLARHLGIPAIFQDNFELDWLENIETTNEYSNHAVALIGSDNNWELYDPFSGFIPPDKFYNDYLPYGEGLDFTKLYHNFENKIKNPLNVDSLEKLKETALLMKPYLF
jgi:hypothetical protein